MSNIINAIYNIRHLDDLSTQKSFIHRLHPLSKLYTTLFFLITVVSFDKYEVTALFPLLIYPLSLIIIADLPLLMILKKVVLVEPLIIGIGIFSPLLDHNSVSIAGVTFSAGWINCLNIIIKCSLTVTAAVIYMAATGMDKIALSLRLIHVPKIFVLQLLLTYRYLSVLLEEVARITKAYRLRSAEQKGVHRKAWGSLMGQLILRSLARAERIYEAMRARGFNGEYHPGSFSRFTWKDVLYCLFWSLFFLAVRRYSIPHLLGTLITGGLF